MPTTNPLFSSGDLTSLLRQPVSDDAAEVVERLVWGWLRPLLGLAAGADRPAVQDETLKAWAIELGAIAYANPEGLSLYALESEKSEYSSERRDEILQAVSTGGVVAPGGVPSPIGNFPPPHCYPDPARTYGRGYGIGDRW